MKKYVLFIIALMICIMHTPLKAQEDHGAARFGIKGGVNLSNLIMKNSEKTKMLTGFNAGIFSKMPFSKALAIQPELYYTTKGAQVTYNGLLVDGTAQFNLNYLELPLLLVVNVTENFNIHFGPYVAYLLDGKVKNESNINLFDFEKNINKEDFNKMDAGIAAGAAIDMGPISLGARYNYGLNKIGKEKTFLFTSYTFPDATNGVLNFYISLGL